MSRMNKSKNMSKKNNRAMWEYLESIEGLLERGSDAEIKEAKKAYRKTYLLKYKQKQRLEKPEFNVNFSTEGGEYDRVEQASKRHDMTITAFIREATLSYITKTYVVPDKMGIAHIEQLLANCLNEIQTIIKQKEHYSFEREQKCEIIEKRIEKLEEEINQFFRQPLPVEEYVKRAVTKDPKLREQILSMLHLSDDNKDSISSNEEL
jgi:hypothetical protein